MKTYLTNARIILEDSIIENGSVLISKGQIFAINPDSVEADEIIDLKGKTLMPGIYAKSGFMLVLGEKRG